MGFRENKNKLGTRVRSAFDRLRPSKSSVGLSNIMKGELSMIRAVSPMPLPVLTLSSSISHRLVSSTLMEGVMRDSFYHEPWSLIKSSQEHQEPARSPVDVYKINSSTAHDKVLQRQGVLASPINLRLASPTQFPLYFPRPSVPIPKQSGLSRSHTSGPFTPELEKNPAGGKPEHVTSTTTPKSNGYFTKTKPPSSQPCSRSSSPTSVYSEESSSMPSSKEKEAWLTPENPTHQEAKWSVSPPENPIHQEAKWSVSPPENPTHQEAKWSVSPARHFLRRRGPTPTTQPLSSRLLQSIVSSPPAKPLSVQSTSTSSDSDRELSNQLELSRPGRPRAQDVIDDTRLEYALLARTEPLRIVRTEVSPTSYKSWASTYMTDLTASCSNSSS
ncbi:uncharacterized protein MELLADRAFT_76893 [Melampsora larici-populina 98AG31]|uniref:Uncharacterized protein n=1 Tax=Melampsora larici-populina (strain 98AG31 / pathotype 3-4-7) TaxID=747676 RepID=F4RA09_MELLP|nr:uncharacterized protein MELLADRAFT_76893 [Melampsora larici-populina 98AG31]EGG10626.1 hypothetical protein MELLADRAFT_76893 [Melampsora larici-populina 98AG31]